MAQADQEAGHAVSRRRCAGLVQAKTEIPEGDQSNVVEGDERRRRKRVPVKHYTYLIVHINTHKKPKGEPDLRDPRL
jgi:hypothetical protein